MTDSPLPRAALLLGLAGLLPSIGMLALMLARPDLAQAAARIGMAYGALIASFVGGAWWGLAAARADAVAQPRWLIVSVLPSLIAWPALLLPAALGLVVLAVLFAALLAADARLQREDIAPPWWMALRRILSPGMAALHAGAAMVLVLSARALAG